MPKPEYANFLPGRLEVPLLRGSGFGIPSILGLRISELGRRQSPK
jgi:hypothetical protein